MSEEEIAAKKVEIAEWAEDDRIKREQEEAEEAEEAAKEAAEKKANQGDEDGDVEMKAVENGASNDDDTEKEGKEEEKKISTPARPPTPDNVQTYYLIKWTSMGYDEATWERKEDIERLEDVVSISRAIQR